MIECKRIFTGVQHGHGVACQNYQASPYRTGHEEVIGSRCDELFVVQAEDDGVVSSVTKDTLTIDYKTLGKKHYELGIRHGTVTGTVVPHTRITDLTPGQKVNKTTAIIFNSGFFERSALTPDNVVYKHGVLTRVAFCECPETHEDGITISSGIAEKLATPGTTMHGVILDFDTVVHNLVEVGDTVTPESILCTLERFINDETSFKDVDAVKALNQISANNPKAKVYGKVTEIEVLYFGDIDDMHITLQKIVRKYDTVRGGKVNKYGYDDSKTGRINESVRVNGSKVLQNQLVIKVFIDGNIEMNAGDKLVIGNQLKCTVSRVDTAGMYTEDGQEVDALFGYLAVAARVVLPEIAGMAHTVLKEISKQAGLMFKK